MNKQDVVNQLTAQRYQPVTDAGSAFAPVNIALIKYWGKRDEVLNLPLTSSLSISLGRVGTRTTVQPADRDVFVLNGKELAVDHPACVRLRAYLDLFRSGPVPGFHVSSQNDVPTAAGLASSASGFAALVCALNALFSWELPGSDLSMLARLGSGSASRSVYRGFVEWQRGEAKDGMDSFAQPLDVVWPQLRVGVLTLSTAEKAVSSREGMRRTAATSQLYTAWPRQVTQDLDRMHRALEQKDFSLLGQTAEQNALAMHATMMAASPPVLYWEPESLACIQRIQRLRSEGLPVYFTMDAGPNVKLLFEQEHESRMLDIFPECNIIEPFEDIT